MSTVSERRTAAAIRFRRGMVRGARVVVPLQLVLLLLSAGAVQAQGTASVALLGVPPVVTTPALGALARQYEAGLFPVQFTYAAPGARPTPFRFRVEVRLDGAPLVETTSEATEFAPGVYLFRPFERGPVPVRFPESLSALLDRAGAEGRAIRASGLLAEGTYSLTIEALPDDPGIASLPGAALFSVRYAQPPTLFSPADGALVVQRPVLAWAPVLAPTVARIVYDVRVVEQKPGQTPLQALEGNRPHVEKTVAAAALPYTPDLLPLDPGHRYVWQVRARDENTVTAFVNDGLSDLWTFSYVPEGATPQDPRLLTRLVLEPGFAVLTDLRRLAVQEAPDAYTFDGPATLTLTVNGVDVPVDVDVRGLRVQPTGLDTPVLLDGTLGGADLRALAFGDAASWLGTPRLSWRFGEGFGLTSDLRLPDGRTVAATGRIQLGRTGLAGVLSAEGAPLVTVGDARASAEVSRLAVRFPEARAEGAGTLRLFGQTLDCPLAPLTLGPDGLFAEVDCADAATLALVPDVLTLGLRRLTGAVRLGDASALDLRLDGAVRLALPEGHACTAEVDLAPGTDGWAAAPFTPTCDGPALARLGLADVGLERLRFERLTYAAGRWDFAAGFDAALAFRLDGDAPAETRAGNGPNGSTRLTPHAMASPGAPMRVPTIGGAHLTPEGVTLPATTFGPDETAAAPVFALGGFDARLNGLVLPDLTLPWRQWQQGVEDAAHAAVGAWQATVDLVLSLPARTQQAGEGAAQHLPPCLQHLHLPLDGVRLDGAGLRGTLPTTVIPEPGCAVPLGGDASGFAFHLRELGGTLSGTAGLGGLAVDVDVRTRGDLTAAAPFACNDATETRLATTELRLRPDGLLEGRADHFAPACPLAVAGFDVRLTEGNVVFRAEGGRQRARTDGRATATTKNAAGQTLTATGRAGVDLTTGEIDPLDLDIVGPFRWGLPEKAPVLSFLLDRARLSRDGLRIHGVQGFEVQDSTLDVRFDSVHVGLDGAWQGGQIVFDEGFAFALSLDSAMARPGYRTSLASDSTVDDPGVKMTLDAGAVFDGRGLATDGRGVARIALFDRNVPDLVVDYQDGFRIAADPFGVSAGHADFFLGGTRIAVLDAAGFHPDPNAFHTVVSALLPARIPLPSEDIAYLQIRDDRDSLLVLWSASEDGTIRIAEKPGVRPTLVVPILRDEGGAQPMADAQLQNVVFNPLTQRIEAGRVAAVVQQGRDALDLTRIGAPFTVRELAYERRDVAGEETHALFFDGTITVFGERDRTDHPASLYVRSDGFLRGVLDVVDLDIPIPLVPGGDSARAASPGEDRATLAGRLPVFAQRPGFVNRPVFADRAALTAPAANDSAYYAQYRVKTVGGTVEIPLRTPDLGHVELRLGGDLELLWPGGRETAARVDARLTERRLSVEGFAGLAPGTDGAVGGPFVLRLDRLNGLRLSWDRFAGLDWSVDLDVSLGVRTDSFAFVAPIKGFTAGPRGFSLPQQETHRQSTPALDARPFTLGTTTLLPLAMRLDRSRMPWGAIASRAGLGLLPRFDFEVTLTGLDSLSPGLSETPLTLADAGFTDAILTGRLLPYTFPGDGFAVPIGGASGPQFRIKTIAGGFVRLPGPAQGVDVRFTGTVGSLPGFTADDGAACAPVTVAARLSNTRGLEGETEGFVPCGTFEVGAFALRMTRARLRFRVDEGGAQRLDLLGRGTVRVPSAEPGTTDFAAEGEVRVDLRTGTFDDGFIELTQPFAWALPTPASPLFPLRVERGRLDPRGLLLTGTGRLSDAVEAESGQRVNVDFDNFRLGFGGNVTAGRATLRARTAFEVGIGATQGVRLVPPAAALARDNVLKLVVPADVAITPQGMEVAGETEAALRLGGEVQFAGLRLAFGPADDGPFLIAFPGGSTPPFFVQSGQAQFFNADRRVGWLDRRGFHEDDLLAVLPTPDLLGLPTPEVAFARLKDAAGNLLLELSNEGDGMRRLRTRAGQPVPVVLPALAPPGGAAPSVAATFDVGVDDAFRVSEGALDLDLRANPLDVQAATGLPVALTRLRYAQGSPYSMGGALKLLLPGALGALDLDVSGMRLGRNGFEGGTFTLGAVPEALDATLPVLQSLTLGPGTTLGLQGIRLTLGAERGAAFAALLRTDLITTTDGQAAPLFLRATFGAGGTWAVALGVAPDDELRLGTVARMRLTEAAARLDRNGLAVSLAGLFTLPDVLGPDFAVRVNGLTIGDGGVRLDAQTAPGVQQISLLDGIVTGQVDRMAVRVDNSALRFGLDGTFTFADRNVAFTGLQVGSDGTFALAEADLLPGPDRLVVVENVLALSDLRLALENGRLRLDVAGEATLPAPFQGTGTLAAAARLTAGGTVEVTNPTLAFALDATRTAGNNPAPQELDLGGVATLEVTGAAVDFDLRDLTRSAVYATASAYFNGDDDKRLDFGDPTRVREQPGLRLQRGAAPQWSVALAQPFDFSAGLFNFQLESVAMSGGGSVFEVEIGGGAGLGVEGVEGMAFFSGLRFGAPTATSPDVIKAWPRFEGATFTVMGIASLEVGAFTFLKDASGNGIPVQIAEGSSPENQTTTTVSVREYLRFGGNGPGDLSAVRMSLTDLFEGGVEEVLVYRDVEGNVRLYVKNASFALMGMGALNASLKYAQGPSGFSLLVAGGGTLTGLGGFAAAGKFGVMNGQLSMGVFLAVRSEAAIPLLPMAPPVVGLTGVGGGLFIRPEAADLAAVTGAVAAMDPTLGFMLGQRGLPPTDAGFAAMAYAGFALLGQGPVATMEGSVFLELTDRYVNLTAAGTLVEQGDHLTGGLTATLNWANLSFQGRLAAEAGYAPALDGTGDLGFSIAVNAASRQITWLLDGGFEAAVVGVDASGNLAISPAGFYADLSINADYNFAVVQLSGSFFAKVWMIPDPRAPLNAELGAYAELEVGASVLGVSVTGTARGTFVTRAGRPSLYAVALVRAEVPFVGSVEVGVFADFRNGQLHDAGVLQEVDGAFADLLAEAAASADAMAGATAAARSAAEAAQRVEISDATLAAAGLNAQRLQQSGVIGSSLVAAYALTVRQHDEKLFTPAQASSIPAGWAWVVGNVMSFENRPGPEAKDAARSRMTTARAAADAQTAAVVQTLRDTRLQAVTWQADAATALTPVPDPVRDGATVATVNAGGFTVGARQPFGVDEAAAAQAQAALQASADAATGFAARDAEARAALSGVEANLGRLDALLTAPGAPLTAQGGRYAAAREATSEYFARTAAYYWELHRWAQELRDALRAQSSAIRDATNAAVTSYAGLPNATARSRCSALGYSCNTGRDLALEVTVKRAELLNALAGVSFAANTAQTNALGQELNGLLRAGRTADFDARFRTLAQNWYYDQHDLGLTAYRDSARALGERVNDLEAVQAAPLLAAHEGYTTALDSLYAVKARLTETLYGLLDTYFAARRAAGIAEGANDGPRWRTLQTRLGQALEPPAIATFTARAERLSTSRPGFGSTTQTRPSFLNRASLAWTATHPLGSVESSLDVGRTGDRTHTARPASWGNATAAVVWTYRFDGAETSVNQGPRAYTVTLRTRAPAGYTTRRQGTFESITNSDDDNGWATALLGSGRGGSTSILTADATPPPAPTLLLDSLYRFDGATYWTANPSVPLVRARAADAETGILRFEARIGTGPYAPLVGVRTETPQGVQLDARLPAALVTTLPTDRATELRVRAVNGAQAAGAETIVRLRADVTPPAWTPRLALGTVTPTTPGANATAPVSRMAPVEGTPVTPAPAARPMLSWTAATDAGAGGVQYEVAVTPARTAAVDWRAADVQRLAARQLPAPAAYGDTVFVHVRALDRLGHATETAPLALRLADPTPPSTPAVTLVPVGDALRVHVERAARDPESGVGRYEVAVASAPDRLASATWAPLGTFRAGAGRAPYADLPAGMLSLEKPAYVAVRAVNGQGRASALVVGGPVALDHTPPVLAALDVATKDAFDVLIEGVDDPQSALARVRVDVLDAYLGTALASATLLDVTKPEKGPLQYHTRLTPRERLSTLSGVLVRVTMTNGAGGETVREQSLDLNPALLAAPDAPPSVQASFNRITGVRLTWAAPANRYVTGYLVYRRTRTGRVRLTAEPIRVLTLDDRAGTAATLYEVESVSVTGAAGLASAPVSATTTPATASR